MNDVKVICYGISLMLQSRHCCCDVTEMQPASHLYSEPDQPSPCPLSSHFLKIHLNITSQNKFPPQNTQNISYTVIIQCVLHPFTKGFNVLSNDVSWFSALASSPLIVRCPVGFNAFNDGCQKPFMAKGHTLYCWLFRGQHLEK